MGGAASHAQQQQPNPAQLAAMLSAAAAPAVQQGQPQVAPHVPPPLLPAHALPQAPQTAQVVAEPSSATVRPMDAAPQMVYVKPEPPSFRTHWRTEVLGNSSAQRNLRRAYVLYLVVVLVQRRHQRRLHVMSLFCLMTAVPGLAIWQDAAPQHMRQLHVPGVQRAGTLRTLGLRREGARVFRVRCHACFIRLQYRVRRFRCHGCQAEYRHPLTWLQWTLHRSMLACITAESDCSMHVPACAVGPPLQCRPRQCALAAPDRRAAAPRPHPARRVSSIGRRNAKRRCRSVQRGNP